MTPLLPPRAALERLIDAARAAGEIGLRFARDGAKTFTKADKSPVTEADLAIDKYLTNALHVTPGVAWMSEETADSTERLSARQVWIVDPIDGTRGFVAGNGEWVISAALVTDGAPSAGVLFRPTTGDLYEAIAGEGAYLNGRRLSLKVGDVKEAIHGAGPKPMIETARKSAPLLQSQPKLASLALRLAYLAENRLDAAFAKENSHDWDIAAADLIVQEAGGCVSGPDGERIVYNRADPIHPPLIAAGHSRHAGFIAAFR